MAIEYGDELVQIVQIDQPLCSLTYGSSPCAAVLGTTGTKKCFNTRFTCQDSANYTAGTLTLSFSRPQEGLESYGYVIPSLDGLNITPLKINVGAMDRGLSPFGQREVVTVSLEDHQHSDLRVDKYRTERATGVATVTEDAYLALGGAARIGTPDSATISVVGDIDIRVKAALDDWTPATANDLASKWGTAGQRSWSFYVDTTGNLVLTWSTDGTAATTATSTAAPTVTDGAALWVRATLDVDNGASGYDAKFYTSSDGETWTQLGSTVTGGATTSIFDGTQTLYAGSDGATRYMSGDFYFASVRSGIDGTVVAKCDASEAGNGVTSWTSLVGEVWTVTGTSVVNPNGYDPHDRGTFWGKWLARNPYHEGYALRVYDGVVGQALADMDVRHYLVDKITGPNDGTVTIIAKDLFSKAEDRKAKAPLASQGELAAAITSAAGTATLSPTGIGDLEYPASGYVVIGEEIIAFTRSSDTLTLTTRGALNTTAAAHDDEDKVQLVLVYSGQSADVIVADLLTTYAGISSSNIPTATWAAEAVANLTNLYTAYITEPTAVSTLVGELAEQAGFSIWPDVSTGQIQFKAIVSGETTTYAVDDDAWIVDGSLSIRRNPEQRVSQVWHYFGQVNPVKKLDETSNYRSRVIVADLNAEDATQYGTASVKEIFSRWIPQYGRASATETAERILAIFRDPPFRSTFTLYADRDGQLALATPFSLTVDEVQDDTGSPVATTHVPIKLIRVEDEVRVESQRLSFYTESGSAPGGGSIRDIFIDNDTLDVNIRTAHDLLYSAPVSGDLVRVYIAPGVVVGSSSTSTPALNIGSWPAGVDIEIYIYTGAYVAGKGGAGGHGNDSSFPGANGLPGGLAFSAQYPVSVYNGGTIQGGGGGGGGGGSGLNNNEAQEGGGGGGGGGAGSNGGGGGAGSIYGSPDGQTGATGTTTAGGAGGLGGGANSSYGQGGRGGTGGAPGQAGSAGSAGTVIAYRSPGSGGAAGAAIEGVANITWIDANGDPSVDDGTILGATS